jgi:hydrogenase maturation factor HypF (carbamoyltransferase family)
MSYLRPLVASFVLLGLAVPADAAMTVQTFLARVDALRDQGPMALMSPDFAVLKAEAKTAKTELKSESAARVSAGKKPIACVPEGQSIGIMDMLDGLAALPAAYQKRPLKDGYAQVLAKRFPC